MTSKSALKPKIKFHLVTIFPEIFKSYLEQGIIKRALEKKFIVVNIVNLRDFTDDAHKTVDDRPFGGGAGMILKIEPIYKALKSIDKTLEKPSYKILLSSKGASFNQQKARELSKKEKEMVLICGRYEGVDDRVSQHLVDETISIGDYILTGGELPALILVDAVTRLIKGVLGNQESAEDESFSQKNNIEYPQYTRPANFKGLKVPEVLLSGDHEKIQTWKDINRKNKKD